MRTKSAPTRLEVRLQRVISCQTRYNGDEGGSIGNWTRMKIISFSQNVAINNHFFPLSQTTQSNHPQAKLFFSLSLFSVSRRRLTFHFTKSYDVLCAVVCCCVLAKIPKLMRMFSSLSDVVWDLRYHLTTADFVFCVNRDIDIATVSAASTMNLNSSDDDSTTKAMKFHTQSFAQKFCRFMRLSLWSSWERLNFPCQFSGWRWFLTFLER